MTMRACALLALAGLGACADNDRSLSITHFVPPKTSNGACTIDPAVAVVTTRGVWDLDLATGFSVGYDVYFVVQSNLMALSSAPIDTQAFYVSSFDVELEPQGAVAVAIPPDRRNFNYPTGSVRLAPGDSQAEEVQVIPPDLLPGIAALSPPYGTIVARIRPVATRAEEQFEGAFVDFPVEMCKGCLSGSIDACPLPTGTTALEGNACNFSVDQAVTCCDAAGRLLCGKDAPIATM